MKRSTWIRITATSVVAVGVTAVTKSPLAEFLPVVFAANLFQSQAGEAIGTLTRRIERSSQSRDSQVVRGAQDSALITETAGHIDAQRTVAAGEHKESDAERQGQDEARTDRVEPAADTALRAGQNDPARRLQELRQEGRDIIADMNKAAVNDRFQDVDALLDRLGQVRAEHRTLEATPETADPSRENMARGPGLPETERQDAPPEAERADGPDGRPPNEAEQATDARQGSTSSAAEVSDADARRAAVVQAEPEDPSSESGARGDARPENQRDESQRRDVDPTWQPETEREPTVGEGPEQTPTGDQGSASEASPGSRPQQPETEREPTVGEAAKQTPTSDQERAGQAPLVGPTQPAGTERDPTVDAGAQQKPASDHERDPEVPAGDSSAERPSQEAGSAPQPPSPGPVSEPSREPRVPAARYPGSGVSPEQLQAMKGPGPRFEPPESVTDAASRKQAALAAMTSDRPARQQPSESTAEQADQAHHPEPSTGAAPTQPARDREMD